VTDYQLSDREIGWLRDIVHYAGLAIEWSASHTTSESLENNLKDRAAVERMLEIVTEACQRMERGRPEPGRFAELFSEPTIHQIRGMGNVLRHDYSGVVAQTIFDTVQEHLPALRHRANVLLASPD